MSEPTAITRHSADIAVISNAVGKHVEGLYRDQFFFGGVPDYEDCGSLEVRLRDQEAFTLSTASDGESVRASVGRLPLREAFVMTEAEGQPLCEWRLVEVTALPNWSRLKGAVLVSVQAKIDVWNEGAGTEVIAGWRLCFETGDFFVYCNEGDKGQLYFNEWPPTYPRITTLWKTIAST